MTAVEAPAGTPAGQKSPEPVVLPRRRRRVDLVPYILAVPTLLILSVMMAWPLINMIMLSFQKLTLTELFADESGPWVGLDNYIEVLTDSFFWTVVMRTILVAAACVALSMGGGMLLALLMRRVSTWVRLTITVALMLVWSLPQLVATQVFYWMFDTDFGVVNWFIDQIPGVDFSNHSWFIDPKQGWAIIIGLVVWGALPFIAISLYAGLTQVPKELVEAAVVDGANAWGVFRNVTFPILRTLLGILTTLSIIWDMQIFTQVYVMRNLKPEHEYFTLSVYSYLEAFGKGNYSLGSAIALITVLLMVGVMFFYVRQMIRIGEAD